MQSFRTAGKIMKSSRSFKSNSHRFMTGWVIGLAILTWSTAQLAAEDLPLKRWALLCTADLEKDGLGDLLMLDLQRDQRIELVERQELARVTAEWDLNALVSASGTAVRQRLGNVAGADVLLIVTSIKAKPDDPITGVQVAAVGVKSGLRLVTELMPYETADPRPTAKRIADFPSDLRQKFERGLNAMMTVPPFRATRILPQYDHLQEGAAQLLGSMLATAPGIAIVDLEEAQAVSRELALRGTEAANQVRPVYVEGSYFVEVDAEGQASVSLTLKVDGPDRVKSWPAVAVDDLPKVLNEAAAWLLSDLGTAPRDPTEQAAKLADRAILWHQLGYGERAIELGEAALLVEPDNIRLRLEMAGWYRQQISTVTEQIEDLRRNLAQPEVWALVDQHTDLSIRFMNQIEWLAHRKAVDYSAEDLIRRLYQPQGPFGSVRWLFNQYGDPMPGADLRRLEPAQAAVRRWLTEIHPRVLQLLPGQVAPEVIDEQWHSWLAHLIRTALQPIDHESITAADLEFLTSTLERWYPADLPPTAQGLELFAAAGWENISIKGHVHKIGFTEEDWKRCLDRLAASPNRGLSYLGQFGLVSYELRGLRQGAPELEALLAEINELFSQFGPEAGQYPITSTSSENNNWITVMNLRWQVWRRTLVPDPDAHWRPYPVARPDITLVPAPPIQYRRLEPAQVVHEARIEPLEGPTLKTRDGRSQPYPAAETPLRVLACDQRFDLFWNESRVDVMEVRDVLKPVWSDAAGGILDVVWDGEWVWIAHQNQGLLVFHLDGELQARIALAEGLPPAERGLKLASPRPGEVVAVGATGDPLRTWAASVRRVEASGEVKVFFQAEKVTELHSLRPAELGSAFIPTLVCMDPTGVSQTPRVLFGGRVGLFRCTELYVAEIGQWKVEPLQAIAKSSTSTGLSSTQRRSVTLKAPVNPGSLVYGRRLLTMNSIPSRLMFIIEPDDSGDLICRSTDLRISNIPQKPETRWLLPYNNLVLAVGEADSVVDINSGHVAELADLGDGPASTSVHYRYVTSRFTNQHTLGRLIPPPITIEASNPQLRGRVEAILPRPIPEDAPLDYHLSREDQQATLAKIEKYLSQGYEAPKDAERIYFRGPQATVDAGLAVVLGDGFRDPSRDPGCVRYFFSDGRLVHVDNAATGALQNHWFYDERGRPRLSISFLGSGKTPTTCLWGDYPDADDSRPYRVIEFIKQRSGEWTLLSVHLFLREDDLQLRYDSAGKRSSVYPIDPAHYESVIRLPQRFGFRPIYPAAD